MKKLRLLLVICAVALLSGCKYEYKMKITEDKKVNFEFTYGIPKDYAVEDEEEVKTTAIEEETPEVTTTGIEDDDDDLTTEDITTIGGDDSSFSYKPNCNDLKEKLGEGWTVEEYSDEKVVGCKMSITYDSIDAISGDKEVVVELVNVSEGQLDDKQLFTKNGDKYSAHFKFGIKDLMDSSKEEMQGMDQLVSLMLATAELNYTVELPYKNLSNNATTVSKDGKTLTWKLATDKNTDIKYSFNFTGKEESKIPWLYIGIAGGALLVIIIIIIIVSKCKKCDCSNCSCDKKEVVNQQPKVEEVTEPVIEEVKEEIVEPVVETAEPVVEEVTEEVVEPEVEEPKTEENNQ